MPLVHNKYHNTAPNGAVYCGRGSRYGNPFVIGRDGDRDEVCDKFEKLILPNLDVSGLRGKDLICFCKPKRCHCDAILLKANMENEKIKDEFWCGDCLELMKDIPDGSVDMILCDLPYGTTQNKWDAVIPFNELWEQYWRVAKSTAMIALTASQPFTSALVMSQPKFFKHEWIWIKNRGSNFANTVREPMKEHESVLMFSKGKWTYNKQMQDRAPSSASAVGKVQKSKRPNSSNYGQCDGRVDTPLTELRVPSSWQKFNCEVGLHPTQKPVTLFEYLIKTYTNPGETVLDNTAGSGTTAIAAINTRRNWICIEKDEEYFNKACDRIEAHKKTLNEKN